MRPVVTFKATLELAGGQFALQPLQKRLLEGYAHPAENLNRPEPPLSALCWLWEEDHLPLRPLVGKQVLLEQQV